MGWATFWDIFSQTHLVSLPLTLDVAKTLSSALGILSIAEMMVTQSSRCPCQKNEPNKNKSVFSL
jgi:hypothetical protein